MGTAAIQIYSRRCFVVVRVGGPRESVAGYIARSFLANAITNITVSQVFLLVNGCDGLNPEIETVDDLLASFKSSESGVLGMYQSIDSSIRRVPESQIIPYSSHPSTICGFFAPLNPILNSLARQKQAGFRISSAGRQVRLDVSPEAMHKVFNDSRVIDATALSNPEFKRKIEMEQEAWIMLQADLKAKLDLANEQARMHRAEDVADAKQSLKGRNWNERNWRKTLPVLSARQSVGEKY
jgi:hypothetical protein